MPAGRKGSPMQGIDLGIPACPIRRPMMLRGLVPSHFGNTPTPPEPHRHCLAQRADFGAIFPIHAPLQLALQR